MKKLLIWVLGIFVLTGAMTVPVFAKKRVKIVVVKKRPLKKRFIKKQILKKKILHRRWKADKIATRRYINQTARILRRVKLVVKKHKIYTGNLLRAYRHQRKARALYLLRRFRRAFYHSRRARILAWKARAANKPFSLKEKKEVEKLNHDGYSEIPANKLDKEVDTESLSLGNKKIKNDSELVQTNVDLEVK